MAVVLPVVRKRRRTRYPLKRRRRLVHGMMTCLAMLISGRKVLLLRMTTRKL